MDNTTKMINGPLNVARLEGKIKGINKVLYLFMDMHLNPYDQTECDGIDNIDVDKFLMHEFDNFQKKQKVLDVFVEIRHEQMIDETPRKGMYIDKILKIFRNQYSSNKNKVSHAKDYKNVRLHYMDFRDYIPEPIMYNIDLFGNGIDDIQNKGSISPHDLDKISTVTNIVKINLAQVLSILKVPKKTKAKIITKKTIHGITTNKLSSKEKLDVLNNMVYKIKHVYKDNNIKKIIVDQFNSYFVPRYENFLAFVTKFLIDLDKKKDTLSALLSGRVDSDEGSHYYVPPDYVRSVIMDLENDCDKIYAMVTNLHANLIDYYMMRRFLDKEYITTSLSYTGIRHSVHMLRFLLKYFDFKLTHLAKSPDKDLNKVSMDIKNTSHALLAEKFIYPPYQIQCSDLTEFPDDFE